MRTWFALLIVTLALLGPNAVRADTIFGVATGNVLVRFDSSTPGTLLTSVPITGLRTNEVIEGIDFRPANGQLYGLGVVGTSGVVYQLNTTTAVATSVLTGLSLSGDAFGFDFNPVPDALRIVSNAEQNLRITSPTSRSSISTPRSTRVTRMSSAPPTRTTLPAPRPQRCS